MLSIVIPVYNNWEMTHQLLFDIYKNLPQDVEVVVVDDNSPKPDVISGLEWWQKSMMSGRLKIYSNEENLGFLRSSNFGVKKSTKNIVVLMNNDVRINDRNFCEKIISVIDSGSNPTLAGVDVYTHDTGWNKFGDKVFSYVGGWLLGFRKLDWEKFGGFDERYIPYDFEDVDISTTYLHNGGQLVSVNLDVVHLGGQSYKYSPEREKQTKINQKKFEDKWVKN